MPVMYHILFLQYKVDSSIHNKRVWPVVKQSRLSFPNSKKKSSKPFQLVHMDVWRPYRTTTHDKKYYALIVVDDFSRATWIFLMQLKNKTTIFLKEFLCMVKTQFDTLVKIIKTDNGTEFFSCQWNEFLRAHGVFHQSSCVYIPQQNDIVERKHRYILDIARALKFQANIPSKYWLRYTSYSLRIE